MSDIDGITVPASSSPSPVDRLIRFTARADSSHSQARFRLLNRLLSRSNDKLSSLPERLRTRLFRLKAGWKVLDFTDRDWEMIARLDDASPLLNDNLLVIVCDYILANQDRVNALAAKADQIDEVLFSNDPSQVVAISSTVGLLDTQSLYLMRLYGAMLSNQHEQLLDTFRSNDNSPWVRQRFTYPLVYHAINIPQDSYLDTFLSYIVPEQRHQGRERRVMRYLLRDDLASAEPFAVKAYLALSTHPYDAADLLASHFETELASTGQVSSESLEILEGLLKACPVRRLREIVDLAKADFAVQQRPQVDARSSVARNAVTSLVRFLDIEDDGRALPVELPVEIEALARMRWSLYPDESDFDQVAEIMRVWRFTDYGRLLQAFMTSIYMLARTDELAELKSLNRLRIFAGTWTPLLLTGPSGDIVVQKALQAGKLKTAEITTIHALAASRRGAADRTWFSAVHCELNKLRDSVRVREWLHAVRLAFPIRPRFLTGIRWSWIDEIIPVTKIVPFRATADGPYVLLLRYIEESRRDSTRLRTAMEPFTTRLTANDFTRWLLTEYGDAGVAFVRYFLSPKNISLLKLAPNLMAALSERISALELCVSSLFKFSEYLDAEYLTREQQTLTSALMLMHVNANQFDIPWADFSRDAFDRERDNYNTYLAMSQGDKTLQVVTDVNTSFPHRFANGAVGTFVFRTSEAPLMVLILGILDMFYDHPSYGIEAILSTRIRHDVLRREFDAVVRDMEGVLIDGVVQQDQKTVIDAISPPYLATIDGWLSERMQTRRAEYTAGLFDFVPTNDDVQHFLKRLGNHASFDLIMEMIQVWIGARLDHQLERARHAFLEECIAKAAKQLEADSMQVRESEPIAPEVITKVAVALSGALERRAGDLLEWFRAPDPDAQKSLTYYEMRLAIEGRFEDYVSAGLLEIRQQRTLRSDIEVSASRVRLYFDLFSEIVANAIKRSGLPSVTVRVSNFEKAGAWGFIYSSAASYTEQTQTRTIPGHPYITLSDALFREGNSGLAKIGAIAASLRGCDLEIIAVRKKRSFHLIIPVGEAGGGKDG